MNEFFAADPASCENSADLRFLLANFGPHAGRYLAYYPSTWAEVIKRRCDELGQHDDDQDGNHERQDNHGDQLPGRLDR